MTLLSRTSSRRRFRSKSLLAGGLLTGIAILSAAVSIIWTPYPIDVLDVASRLQGASAAHLLGTDQFGRDLVSMLMTGARTSIAVSIIAVGIGLIIGVPLGLTAAQKGGLGDEVLMRVNDVIFAFPALLSAVMITALMGPGAINAIIAIGIFNIPVFARVARGGALALSSRDFLAAARLSGKGEIRVTLEHILPNIASLLIVQATIQMSMGILAEAGLSYVGLGAQPPLTSWGRMLNESQTMMAFAPQLALYPGLAIVFTVLGLNLLGDGLRDLLDPTLRRRSPF